MLKILARALAAGALVLAAPAFAEPQWPQAHSDLAADPAVRFGVLPNGLRYAVMKNATPAGQISLRLRIGAGSLDETDAQQGLAHVLEHMAFKGSAKVAPGEMIKILQRHGLAFGPDTNAFTAWTQTVYQLDLPHNDADSLDTGVMLLRQIGGELSLAPDQLQSERGVVLSEERLRDTPEMRASRQRIGFLLDGQRAARRWPIGLREVIQNAPASQVRAYYEAHYRPDEATVVIVGDADPALLEAKVREVFGDWRARKDPLPAPDLGTPAGHAAAFQVITLPGAATKIEMAWVKPFDATPDSLAREKRDLTEMLGFAVLNRRLAKLATDPNPPFLGAEAGAENLFHSARITEIETTTTPQGWQAGLAAAERETRRLVQYGVTRAELDREIVEMRAGFETALKGAATRPTAELANQLAESVDQDSVFTSPQADLTLFNAIAKDLTVADVNARLRASFAGAGPDVSLTAPTVPDGGQAALEKAWSAAAAQPVAAPAAETALKWPYGPEKPGAIAERHVIADLGVTEARFANGVTAMVKQTDLSRDQVLVEVRFGGGRLALDKTAPTGWAAGAFIPGGLGQLKAEDMDKALAGRIHGEGLSLDETRDVLSGATRPQDLGVQLQVLAAYLKDPGYRPEAFERLREGLIAALPQLAATPGGVLQRELAALLAGGDPRRRFPDEAGLKAAKADLVKSVVAPSADGIEVTVVGDISPDEALARIAETFGALPPRPAPQGPLKAVDLHFPAPASVTLHHTGRADQAVAIVAWPLTDFYADMQDARATKLAVAVLENRLIDEIRVKQGATYSPNATADQSQDLTGYGYALVEVEIPPEKIDGFFADVSRIVADLAAKGPTADELERARAPKISSLDRAQKTNAYWIATLGAAAADPRRLDLIRTSIPGYQKLTAADVQAAAQRWLRESTAWRLRVVAQ
jgi:zinc protease